MHNLVYWYWRVVYFYTGPAEEHIPGIVRGNYESEKPMICKTFVEQVIEQYVQRFRIYVDYHESIGTNTSSMLRRVSILVHMEE